MTTYEWYMLGVACILIVFGLWCSWRKSLKHQYYLTRMKIASIIRDKDKLYARMCISDTGQYISDYIKEQMDADAEVQVALRQYREMMPFHAISHNHLLGVFGVSRAIKVYWDPVAHAHMQAKIMKNSVYGATRTVRMYDRYGDVEA